MESILLNGEIMYDPQLTESMISSSPPPAATHISLASAGYMIQSITHIFCLRQVTLPITNSYFLPSAGYMIRAITHIYVPSAGYMIRSLTQIFLNSAG